MLADDDPDNSAAADSSSFARARAIYEGGMHSGPCARLTLKEPLKKDVEVQNDHHHHHGENHVSLSVVGVNDDQKAVYGSVLIFGGDPGTGSEQQQQPLSKGQTHLLVQYDEHNPNSCRVGGHPEPRTEECKCYAA